MALILTYRGSSGQRSGPAPEIYAIAGLTRLDRNGLRATITANIGVDQWQVDGQSLDEVMRIADQRMYECKRLGRNRVIAGPDAS